ncbi:hypothetical protein CBR_g36436 [Chara braunii]|uniref:PUA domain-containing protein n=1 Tax=Chara braunii TaxID=69332 RepID=A0A388LKR9_CHABU|nr:hypothetical protein CBR_g36436 [Chara braunii]|eukprot:GBG82909.1 hypothetical protein CBR_g36436 [Chara braunii]
MTVRYMRVSGRDRGQSGVGKVLLGECLERRLPDPDIMRKFQVDRGAIKFVLSGANIMCPGMTSPGGVLDDSVPAEQPVAIMAEGKQHALAIGYTKLSAVDIRSVNKGVGVENVHYLNDGLWKRDADVSNMPDHSLGYGGQATSR